MTEKVVKILYPSRSKLGDTRFAYIMTGFFGDPTSEEIDDYVVVDEFKHDVPNDPDLILEYLESLFAKYNDSTKNPLSTKEKQKMIKDSCTYTSMSIGCAVSISENDKEDDRWIVAGHGWKKLSKN